MSTYVFTVLLLLVIISFLWTCQSSMEAFEDVAMRPWFGYEPGRYGPGWGRKGCVSTPPSSCMMV